MTAPAVQQRLFSVADAATYLGRSEKAVRMMVEHGLLPAVRGDRRVQLDIRDMDKWIQENK